MPAPLSMRVIATRRGVSDVVEDERAELWRDVEGRVFASSHVEAGAAVVRVRGLAIYRARDELGTVDVEAEEGSDPALVASTFARFIRPLLLQLGGAEVLHASAARVAGRLTAICGPTRSGKSTLAAALGRRGHELWSDDTLVWRLAAGGGVVVEAQPFAPRLRPPADELAGEAPRLVHHGEAPLAAIWLLAPAPADAVVSVAEVRRADAAVHLLAQAFAFSMNDERRNRAMVESYLELAARVPLRQLAVPRALARLDEVCAAIEAQPG